MVLRIWKPIKIVILIIFDFGFYSAKFLVDNFGKSIMKIF
ncbi:hypothetical protein DI53_1593 [Sphingobacterium deserti]|uniref:Uncharacterized protein n=1 Tax=Sphingobacterium deserti TaxID=1229276 RepID=A0A0B8T7P9_9SPHI|nr:hypothetical protein DI53_1593 [Sphingobacterium deserti]